MSDQSAAVEVSRQCSKGKEVVDKTGEKIVDEVQKEVVDWQLTNHTGFRLPRLAEEAPRQGCKAESVHAVLNADLMAEVLVHVNASTHD